MTYKKVTSSSNRLVKEALKIKARKGGRHDFLIEGQHLLEMAIGAKAHIRRVFFTSHYRSKSGVLLKRLPEEGCEFIETTAHVLSRLAETDTPQGIVAVVSYKAYDLWEVSLKRVPLIVVCDGIQDPGNLGTIIRTSDAFGADAVILLPGTCDALASKAMRASAGSIFNLPVLTAEPLTLIEWLRTKAIRLIVTELTAPRTIYESDLLGPLAFVFGNEAAGVSKTIRKEGDISLSIPMRGGAESLNVSVAAAICLYETVRQRRLRP